MIRLAATAAALFFAALITTPAAAQNPAGANAAKYGIAVVDISFIFKNHSAFRAKMDTLKNRMQSIEQELQGDRQKLIRLETEKKQFNPGSPEFSKIDEQLTREKAEVQIKLQAKRKGFLEDEGKAYHETYQQVSAAIERYARHYKIGLVLRFNGDVADPKNRQSIIAGINKPVQFQNQIDITPDILALVDPNQQQGQLPVSGRAGQNGVRR